jgi:hypothetical protein
MFVPGKSFVKVQREILDIFFMGARLSSCGQCDVGRLGFVSFYFPFLNQFWIAARLVCSFCEAMAGSLSVASTVVSSARVTVVDSG